MVRMRMIKADDILAALAPFALNADQFLGIDAVAVVGRVRACIAAAGDARDGLPSVIVKLPKQRATALVRISFLSVLPKRGVGGLRKLEHARSEVRGQIAEVDHHNFEGFTSAI
jgi:hypothetical protein